MKRQLSFYADFIPQREELLTLACSGSNFSYCPYQPMAAIQMD